VVLELVVGEELCAEVEVSQQHGANVLLVDPEQLEELGHHVLPVEGHREQALLATPPAAAAGVYPRGRAPLEVDRTDRNRGPGVKKGD